MVASSVWLTVGSIMCVLQHKAGAVSTAVEGCRHTYKARTGTLALAAFAGLGPLPVSQAHGRSSVISSAQRDLQYSSASLPRTLQKQKSSKVQRHLATLRLRGGAGSLCAAFQVPGGIPLVGWDLGVAALTAVGVVGWLKIWTTAAGAGKIQPVVSRKVIHCSSGPLFALLWPFFSNHPYARFIAASVPLLQAVRLTMAGLGTDREKGLVTAISRSGKASEALQGPLVYCLVVVAATVLEWRGSLVGIMALAQMAAGDGLADIVGRKYGRKKWWFSENRSYVGSLAFVAGSGLVSLGLIAWFNFMGCLPITPQAAAGRVLLISLLCALVEVLPLGPDADDNITVPAAAAVLTRLMFR